MPGRIELCHFTPALKNELFPNLRAAFERGCLLIPSNNTIREDLHSIQKIVTPAGHIAFRATHTFDGHSDRATALALALRATQSAPPSTCASSVEVSRYRRT
jgi:phage FluMu gp28-like protein